MQSILEKNNTLLNIVSNLLNFKKEPTSSEGGANAKNQYLKGSISEYTKDLIMTFPVLCDNSLPITTASMISKANERNIISMLEMLFAAMQLDGSNGADILAKLHKNISITASLDDIVDELEKLAETVTPEEKNKIRDCVRSITESLKIPQKSYPINSFSESSLNDYTVYNVYGKTLVREDKSANDSNNAQKVNNNPLLKADNVKDDVDFLGKVLLDQDIKKANEITPSLLIVKFNAFNEKNEAVGKETFVSGVKSRLIGVDSSDLVERLVAKNKTKLSFLNFIRATTGEINFISDFLLCTKQAKIDAKNSVKKGPAAKMWKVLEFRAAKNNKNKVKGFGNDASAITMLVLNQETVNILKKEYDFDVEAINNTKMIMDAYNLLGICICDESIDVAKFFYAGNDLYEEQAYSFLEKENKSNDKAIINLLNSVGR